MTGTPCEPVPIMLTGTPPPTPSYYISGSVDYTGTGSVDVNHPLYVGFGEPTMYQPGGFCTLNISGNYSLGTRHSGTFSIGAYYDKNSLTKYFLTYWQGYPLAFPYVPGMRYASFGGCDNLVSPVTIAGSMGSTTIGPNLIFDDSCSYWGIYGTVTYIGARGTVGICRKIYINAYLDSSYTDPANYTFHNYQNGNHYYFVTNDNYSHWGPTGLSPLYIRAYFDTNGNGSFDSGDSYVELGPMTPTTDGLLLNISFGDTYIK